MLPILTLGLYRLSCVAQNPPPNALLVAHLLLELAYDNRFEGLTYGGVEQAELECTTAFGIDEAIRPPQELEAYGDATCTAGLQAPATPSAQEHGAQTDHASSSPKLTLADMVRRVGRGRSRTRGA